MLWQNSYQRLIYISYAVKDAVNCYKHLYFESDTYRFSRLMQIEVDPRKDLEERKKAKLE
jgi:hypothetical protein